MTTHPRPLPYPARQRIQVDPEVPRHPYQELSAVPHLHSVRFELDLRLLLQTPLRIITVTLPVSHIEDEPYSVDDLKDVIYSRTGLPRCNFWLGTQALQDYTISQVHYTLSLEDLVFYYVNVRQTRPPGHELEFPRPLGIPGSLPYRDPELTAQTWAAPPRLHDDACQQLRISLTAFTCQYEIWTFSETHIATALAKKLGRLRPSTSIPTLSLPQFSVIVHRRHIHSDGISHNHFPYCSKQLLI